ncbi:hypothetical protein GF366_04490 [Candidatus Peregrinibacteria bacterium]|nr:hypothetical protein [Candidatus Peregrinibacteria bacterium]
MDPIDHKIEIITECLYILSKKDYETAAEAILQAEHLKRNNPNEAEQLLKNVKELILRILNRGQESCLE